MSEELKAIDALADALGFDLVKKFDRYEVSAEYSGIRGITLDTDGKCYQVRSWFECNPKQLEEQEYNSSTVRGEC